MKTFVRWKLTLLRDKDWIPEILVKFIDWLRYGILDDSDEYDPYN